MSKKREIILNMSRTVVKPSQKKDVALAANYLDQLVSTGSMSYIDALKKINEHFTVDEADLLKEYNT